jgi:hypothetical protein
MHGTKRNHACPRNMERRLQQSRCSGRARQSGLREGLLPEHTAGSVSGEPACRRTVNAESGPAAGTGSNTRGNASPTGSGGPERAYRPTLVLLRGRRGGTLVSVQRQALILRAPEPRRPFDLLRLTVDRAPRSYRASSPSVEIPLRRFSRTPERHGAIQHGKED